MKTRCLDASCGTDYYSHLSPRLGLRPLSFRHSKDIRKTEKEHFYADGSDNGQATAAVSCNLEHNGELK